MQAKIDAGLAIGLNIMTYANNREVKHKDEIPSMVQQAVSKGPFRRGQIFIANLRHPGGCTAAPRALVNLLETAARELQLGL